MKLGPFTGIIMGNIFEEFFPRFDRLGRKSMLFSIKLSNTIKQNN